MERDEEKQKKKKKKELENLNSNLSLQSPNHLYNDIENQRTDKSNRKILEKSYKIFLFF